MLLGYWPIPFLSPILGHIQLCWQDLCWQSRHPWQQSCLLHPPTQTPMLISPGRLQKSIGCSIFKPKQNTKALANRIVPYVSKCACQGRFSQRLLAMGFWQHNAIPYSSSSWTMGCPCPILFTCQHHKQPSQYDVLGWQPCPVSTTKCSEAWAEPSSDRGLGTARRLDLGLFLTQANSDCL